MTSTPPTEQQLDEIAKAVADYRRHVPTGWAGCSAHPIADAGAALLAEVRRLRDELAAARAAAFGEAEKEIADAIDWNRAEYPSVEGMITRRLGMRAAERVVRALREEAEGGCPGFEGNPVAPDACAGCHEPSDAHTPDAASAPPAAPLGASPASGVSESTQSPTGAATGPRRTLTPGEYNAAWHAVEGSAGEEGADPGTVLHAVLDRLGIQWQDAAVPAAVETGE